MKIKMKLTFRETLISFSALLVMLYFIFDFFLYNPNLKNNAALSREIASFDQKIQETSSFLSSGSSVVTDVQKLKQKLSIYEEKFTRRVTFSQFLEQLALQCRLLNMEVLALRPREQNVLKANAGHSQYRQVFIDLDVRCDYRTFVLFIEALEKLPLFTVVDRLNIQREEHTSTVTCNLVLRTLFS